MRPGHTKCCTCHAKHLSKPDDLMLQNAKRFRKRYKTFTFCALLGRCRIPYACHTKWHLNVHPFGLEMCFAPQRRALYHYRHVNFQKCSENGCFTPQQHLLFSMSQLPKVARAWCVFAFWLGSASRHNGVHFFDISTCKNAPNMRCFLNFDLEMCFAPQRRALFRHLKFQKWSENGVFCTFWLPNALRATTACNCSSLIWLDGFSEPTLRPFGATNHCTQRIATVLPFSAPASSFFWLCLFSDILSSSLLFSDSSHRCFSICPYCRKFDF